MVEAKSGMSCISYPKGAAPATGNFLTSAGKGTRGAVQMTNQKIRITINHTINYTNLVIPAPL